MWTGQSKVIVELFLMLFQKWETRSDNNATEAVRYEANFTQTATWAILIDVVVNFLCQSHPHFLNITLSVVFVCV